MMIKAEPSMNKPWKESRKERAEMFLKIIQG